MRMRMRMRMTSSTDGEQGHKPDPVTILETVYMHDEEYERRQAQRAIVPPEGMKCVNSGWFHSTLRPWI